MDCVADVSMVGIVFGFIEASGMGIRWHLFSALATYLRTPQILMPPPRSVWFALATEHLSSLATIFVKQNAYGIAIPPQGESPSPSISIVVYVDYEQWVVW